MEEKSSYRQKVDAQFEDLKTDLEDLKIKVQNAAADLQAEYQERIRELEPKIVEGKVRLAELAGTADEAWDEVKDGAELILKQMKETFNNVKEKFNKDEASENPDVPKNE